MATELILRALRLAALRHAGGVPTTVSLISASATRPLRGRSAVARPIAPRGLHCIGRSGSVFLLLAHQGPTPRRSRALPGLFQGLRHGPTSCHMMPAPCNCSAPHYGVNSSHCRGCSLPLPPPQPFKPWSPFLSARRTANGIQSMAKMVVIIIIIRLFLPLFRCRNLDLHDIDARLQPLAPDQPRSATNCFVNVGESSPNEPPPSLLLTAINHSFTHPSIQSLINSPPPPPPPATILAC